MIFSSFGNAPAEMSFIRMAHAIDEFAKESEEDVFVQVGNTRYEFKYARIVKFLEHEEMVDAMRRASIVVLQGGWGTISEAIFLKKRIVAIPRRVGQECHHPQEEVVRYLEKLGCLIGCYNTAELPNLIEKARRIEFKTLSRGNAAQYMNPFLDNIK